MNEILYQLIEFERMWFWQRISDGKLMKRVQITEDLSLIIEPEVREKCNN